MDFTGADLKSAANKLGVNGGSENFSKSSKIDHPANSFPLTQNDCDGQVVQYNDNSDEKVYLNGDKKKKKATTSFANLRGSSRLLTCAPSSGIFHMTLIDLLKSLSEDVSLIPILKSFENPLIKSNDTMTNTSAIQKYTMTNFNGVYDEIKQLQLFLFILKVFKQKSPQYFNGEYDGGEKVMLFLPLDAFKNLEALKTNLLEINDNVDVRYPQIFGNGGGYIDGEEFIATLSNVLNNGYNNGSVLSRFGVNICKK
uniref:EF-hand domain-containing protein n=1 Tax=Meloidogyne hapla TaxID=6305 RepID=A0A1I8BN53_MELHA